MGAISLFMRIIRDEAIFTKSFVFIIQLILAQNTFRNRNIKQSLIYYFFYFHNILLIYSKKTGDAPVFLLLLLRLGEAVLKTNYSVKYVFSLGILNEINRSDKLISFTGG